MFSSTALKRVVAGLLIGGLFALALSFLILLDGPASARVYWPATGAVGMLGAWTTVGAAVGLLAGFAVHVIGERCSGARYSRVRDSSVTPLSPRRALRSQRFWHALFLCLGAGPFLTVTQYCRTRGTYRTDGLDLMGWPFPFFTRGGGTVYRERYHADNLLLDVVLWIAIATVAALMAKYGFRRFGVRMLLALRSFLGVSKRG